MEELLFEELHHIAGSEAPEEHESAILQLLSDLSKDYARSGLNF